MPSQWKATLFTVLLLFSSAFADGQDVLNLLGNYADKMAGLEGRKLKAILDSLDFQFAFTVYENAGFFDPQQKGEHKADILSGFQAEGTKTLVEKARDTLEMGLGQYGIRRYKTAERSIAHARDLLETSALTNSMVYLRTTSSLGLIFLVQGRWSLAEKTITASLEKSKKSVGRRSAAYIANINNIAKLHQSQGKYSEAEAEYAEAHQLSADLFGSSMQTAIIVNNQAMLAQTLGRKEQALSLMQQSIAMAGLAPKKILEGQSFDDRRFQLNLGVMMMNQGRYPEAEKKFLEIKKQADNRGQTKSQEYSTLMNLLGSLYMKMSKLDLAEEFLIKAENVYTKRFTTKNYLTARVLHDLGNLYRLAGRYADAEERLNQSLAMRSELFNPKHPEYVDTQESLAMLYAKTGQFPKAYALYRDVMDKTLAFIGEYFPPMSEAEKAKYWSERQTRVQNFYSFALDHYHEEPRVANDFYRFLLATKSLLLNATGKIRREIESNADVQLQKDFSSWLDLRQQLAEAYTFSKNKLKSQGINLEDLEHKANDLERSLSSRSSGFLAEFVSKPIVAGEISSHLGDNEAAVDIVKVTDPNSGVVRYAFFILKKGDESPKIVTLDNEEELNKYYRLYRNTILVGHASESKSFEKLWSVVEREIVDKKVVYVSPDGLYNLINLNTLQFEPEKFLLDRHNFILIGNLKDLTKPDVVESKSNNAVLVGFPDYKSEFEQLPGTKTELENVDRILKSNGYSTTLLMQGNATEKKIKSVKSPAILHIASHGYFFSDDKSKGGRGENVSLETSSADPLLRSGLILSEASQTKKDDVDFSGADNGYLTSYEVMNLQLDGVKLVVLSACETGLGEVQAGEGVYGLQRAFSIAGASVVVMSLWKVDDAATQQLMSAFYKNWTVSRNFQEAFRKAQTELKSKFDSSYYWGAFVMHGI